MSGTGQMTREGFAQVGLKPHHAVAFPLLPALRSPAVGENGRSTFSSRPSPCHVSCSLSAFYLRILEREGIVGGLLLGKTSRQASAGEIPCAPKCQRDGMPGFAAGGSGAAGPWLEGRTGQT